MTKFAYLFPGQGSQAVGMGREAAEHSAEARSLFALADAALGYSLSGMCFDGPEEDLKQTQNTQPALYLSSAATLVLLNEVGLQPMAVAGHSLGEYTALHAAGSLDFETGLRLVRHRGLAFADAGSKRQGAMAAIIGLDGSKVAELCEQACGAHGVAVPANYNEPTQTVISGDPVAVDKACELCKAAGARRALPLPVSGAFHSPLVEPARDAMEAALTDVTLLAPKCGFVNNADAKALSDPADIKDSLVRQVTSSVRWVECIEQLKALGAQAFVEVGSGKVLAGLARRIDRDIPVFTTESWDAIQKTIAELKG